ncbi:MAG: outer membrane protein [Alteromonadaceae bacterium]|jgi:outer membrane protein
MINKLALCLTFLVSLSVFAEKPAITENKKSTSGFLYGAGISISKEIYKGYNSRTMPLPLIGYKSDKLTIFGPFISYEVYEASNVKLLIKAAPRFQGFDDSDSYIFSGMADRQNSMDFGIGLNYQKAGWKVGVSSLFDVLDRSNGIELISAVSHVFRFGPLFIEPQVSLSYLNNAHVDYYYGVKKEEVNQDRTEFIGKSALNTALGLSMATPIFFGGYTRLNIQHTWFASEITNSPLVDDDSNLSFQLFFTKSF